MVVALITTTVIIILPVVINPRGDHPQEGGVSQVSASCAYGLWRKLFLGFTMYAVGIAGNLWTNGLQKRLDTWRNAIRTTRPRRAANDS